MGLIITLIVIGIILLVAELVLLPGISVAGIAAFVSFAAAIFYGFFHFGIVGGSIIVASIVILSIIAVVVSLRANTWRRLSLQNYDRGAPQPLPPNNKTYASASRVKRSHASLRWERCVSERLPSRPSPSTAFSILIKPSR